MTTTGRSIHLDNAKFILILFVVFGHFTLLFVDQPIMRGITNVIYSFHMPIFIFISGFFSKYSAQRKKDVTKILFTYVVFQILCVAYTKTTSWGHVSMNIFIPTHQNWYLLALFTWKLLVPYASFFSKKMVVCVSLLLAFGIGYFDSFGHFLSLHRTLYFMPIFILGYYCEDVSYLKIWGSRYKPLFMLLLVAMVSIIFVLSYVSPKLGNMIFVAYTPRLGYHSNVVLLISRILAYASSAIIGFSVLLIIPSEKIKLLSLGKNTMNAYLLHMFYIYPIVATILTWKSWILTILAFPLLMIITVLISSDQVSRLIYPLTDMEAFIAIFKKEKTGTIEPPPIRKPES